MHNRNKYNILAILSSLCMWASEGKGGKSQHAPAADSAATDNELKQQAKSREEYLTNGDDWDSVDAPEFGGQSEILYLEIGEVARDLLYTGHQTSTIGNKEMEVHTANTLDGTPIRLPIAASFLRALDQARVNVGDSIMVKRFDDATKKGGVGKGQTMQIFGIKVVRRAGEGESAPQKPQHSAEPASTLPI